MEHLKRKFNEFSHFLSQLDVKHFPWPLRVLIVTLRSLVWSAQKFHKDLGFESASSLSFISIISLIPAGFLFFFFMKAFGLHKFWDETKNIILQNFVQNSQGSINKWLTVFEDNPLTTLKNLPIYLLIIVALIFSALWLLEAGEKTLNRIWKTTHQRSYIQRFTIFWVILTASPFLLALSVFIKKQFESNSYFSYIINSNFILNGLYGLILPLFFASLAFFFIFLLLPATKVKILPALLGAIFAGLFWECAQMWLIYYIPKAVTFSLYGSLGAVAAFFLWVYVTWGVLLFGSQLSFVLQYPDYTNNLLSSEKTYYQVPPGFLALSVAVEIVKATSKGNKPPSLSDLSFKWYCSRDILLEEVVKLSPKYFHSHSNDEEIYYLSKDSDHILIQDLLPSFSEQQNYKSRQFNIPNETSKLLSFLETNRKKALKDLTLRDIVNCNISLHSSDQP